MPDPIIISEYDPQWPLRFEEISDRVRQALGPLATRVEHVGSTAVPGLPAKPIIDIDVVVQTEQALPDAIAALATLGYIHQGDLGITGREAFQTPSGTFPHHLYLVAADAGELKRHLTFRDRLRTDAEARREYGELKSELARRFRNDRNGYTEAKTDFILKALSD